MFRFFSSLGFFSAVTSPTTRSSNTKSGSKRAKLRNTRRLTNRQLRFEQVETRQLMAGNVFNDDIFNGLPVLAQDPPPPEALGSITFNPSNGVVTVEGTDGQNDKVDVYINHRAGNGAGDIPDLLTVSLANINTPMVRVFDPGAVTKVIFNGHGGDDYLDNRTWVPLLADGGPGNDVLLGGSGNDLMMGGDGNDYLDGRRGDDTLLGQAGVDALFGDDGIDWLYGGSEVDYLFGGNGDDDLHGEAGNDKMYGEAGNDRFVDTSGTNTKYTDYGPTTYNVSASGFVTFDWFDRYLKDPAVRSLTRLEYRDGVIDRKDMLWDPLESTCRHASLSIL